MTVFSKGLIRFALVLAAACQAFIAAAQDKKNTHDLFPGATSHAPDAFYDPPAQVPAKPGTLLRSEPLKDVTLPVGMRGWRILYTTTVNDSTPATAAATVFAPIDTPPGPRPVIMWDHGTTGTPQRCMPSLSSAPASGIPAPDGIAAAGWVIVATDYQFAEKNGPHPYLIGEGEARAGLDSVRAARQMPELTLDPRTVVWGHSQGGHAALWTGIVGPGYAPEVQIVGVVGIAPAADVAKLISFSPALDKQLGAYVAKAYSRFYPDITFEQAVRPEALAASREIADLCVFLPPEDPAKINQLVATYEGGALAMTNPTLASRVAQNRPDGPIAAPVLIAQGLTDTIVQPSATDGYVAERCAARQRLEYWTFADHDHGAIVLPGTALAAPLIGWTAARFAGQPQTNGCARQSF